LGIALARLPARREWPIEEKQRKLLRQDDVNELIDQIAGITLTHLFVSERSRDCSCPEQ
jgi:hypothetical protein